MAPHVDPAEASSTTEIVRLAPCADIVEAAKRLAVGLLERAPPGAAEAAGFYRLEVPVGAVSPLAWLARRPHASRLYFETPDAELSLAGLGFARSWSDGIGALEALARRLADDPDSEALRFLLTSRFDGAPPEDSPWAGFGRTRIVLPLVELRSVGTGTTLAVNIDLQGTDVAARTEEARELLGVHAHPESGAASFRAICIANEPDEQGWDRAVNETLGDIEAGRLAKCVLARTRTYAIDGTLDPFALLQQAAREQPGTFRFGIQVAPDRAFVGASPEVLFRRRGGEVESEALAGTRRRSNDQTQDERMGVELLESAKDQEEHAYVRRHIEQVLAPLCDGALEIKGPLLRRLAGLQHIDTQLRGTLKHGASDADLLEKLHPTPAVCGVPTPTARASIETREPFDRGLYAGAVGLVGRAEALVTVGIRSALHMGDRVTLLAGAGLVKGSEAEAEWRETDDKMRVLDAILRAGRIE